MIYTKSKTMYSTGYDMTIYIEYAEHNQISGINYMMGDDLAPDDLNESCPFLTQLFHVMFESPLSNGGRSDEEIVFEVCDLHTSMFIREMNFKNRTFTKIED